MSPWVKTTPEELRNRPWPPPDGEARHRASGSMPIDFEVRETRLKDGKFLRKVEVKIAGVVVFSGDTFDDAEPFDTTVNRTFEGFATALRRALEDDE